MHLLHSEGIAMQRLVRLIWLVGLVGCTPSTIPSDSIHQPGPPAVGSRYAVQWHGYIGEQVGTAVRPHLAFVDVFAGGAHRHAPVFNDVKLVGEDGGGPIPARVSLVGIGFEDETYRAVNVDLEIAGLWPGTHRFTAVRYRDEHGAQRRLSIGTYVVEIVGRQTADLSIWQAEVGSGRFERLGVELRNELDAPVTVEGLQFALPDLPVRTTMHRAEPPDAPNSAVPIPAESTDAVTRIELAAGERRIIEFRLSGADPQTFVVLQPLVRYVRPDGSAGLLPLLPHRYAPGFETPSEVEQFLSGVPEDAVHELN